MSQVSIRKTSEPIVQLFGYPHSVVLSTQLTYMLSFRNLSQPFTVIFQTSLIPKITMKIQSNTFPAAKLTSNQSYLTENEKTLKYTKQKWLVKKANFNITHCSVRSKPKQLTDVNNIEIRQIISWIHSTFQKDHKLAWLMVTFWQLVAKCRKIEML